MLWVGGLPVTAPTGNAAAVDSPYVLKAEDEGFAIFRAGTRLAGASTQRRPRFYDLTTADGIPYWKIGLLHLDSFASTVVQTCAYWGNDNQCKFCGIGVSLDSGRTIVKKSPEQLAEVACAAKELDGAVDATLTTGSSNGIDRGARYVARCAQAVKAVSGLPVEIQFEPPHDLDVIDEVGDMGVDAVGIHVESFDPAVLAHVAPAKARTGIDRYFDAWERAVAVFGEGQVSTYVILGMGEDPELTLDGCRRAVDMGVDAVGIHVESFDPAVLAHVAPAKARTGIDRYFDAWERAVAVFGEGQVSTYVILGMGEDPELTLDGCRRAVDMGVFPFVVPFRPVAGSLMEDVRPPDAAYTERIYRSVAGYMALRGMDSSVPKAGCARCQACSGLSSVESALRAGASPLLQIGRRPEHLAGTA
jgi:radical SAM protein (TIGR04043 family)